MEEPLAFILISEQIARRRSSEDLTLVGKHQAKMAQRVRRKEERKHFADFADTDLPVRRGRQSGR